MAFQISVFLENKIGHFEKVTKVLREHQINILTMTLTNTANGWGILNLLVNDPDTACQMLNENGITAALREVIALEMEDKPGGLDDLLIRIALAGINFDNALGRVTEVNKRAMLLLDVPDLHSARRLLKEHGITELSDKTVYGKK